jgi:hypothetical protein
VGIFFRGWYRCGGFRWKVPVLSNNYIVGRMSKLDFGDT